MSYQPQSSVVGSANSIPRRTIAHLRRVTSPEQPTLIFTEGPEYWNGSTIEVKLKTGKRTQGVNEEVVLDFVNIS